MRFARGFRQWRAVWKIVYGSDNPRIQGSPAIFDTISRENAVDLAPRETTQHRAFARWRTQCRLSEKCEPRRLQARKRARLGSLDGDGYVLLVGSVSARASDEHSSSFSSRVPTSVLFSSSAAAAFFIMTTADGSMPMPT